MAATYMLLAARQNFAAGVVQVGATYGVPLLPTSSMRSSAAAGAIAMQIASTKTLNLLMAQNTVKLQSSAVDGVPAPVAVVVAATEIGPEILMPASVCGNPPVEVGAIGTDRTDGVVPNVTEAGAELKIWT